jgi:GT2 family glycosyltransferase
MEQSSVKTQIVVIDNASSDETNAIIEKDFPGVKLIKSEKNLGFGQANNIGMRKALDENADYVFLLNQDAWVEMDTIKGLIEIHKQNNYLGILSPFHLNGTGNDLDKAFYSSMTKSVHGFSLISDLYLNKLNKLYETTYVNAAAWLLPIESLKKTGGFDPIFFHYGEDVNYTQRIIYNGLKIGICPHLNVFHGREEREDVTFDITVLLREHLIEVTNINENKAIKNFRQCIYNHVLNILKALLTLNNKKITVNYNLLVFSLKNYKNIIKSITTNQKINPNWL